MGSNRANRWAVIIGAFVVMVAIALVIDLNEVKLPGPTATYALVTSLVILAAGYLGEKRWPKT